jgi:exonuclease I
MGNPFAIWENLLGSWDPKPRHVRIAIHFVFYDTETTGMDTTFDQILQFAAILIDDDLHELDRFETRLRLLPHVIPAPEALLATRVCFRPNVSCAKKTAEEHQTAVAIPLRRSVHGTKPTYSPWRF